ncbi:MAG: hypothetical protein J2P19_18245 [Pseudonocardia sp.]|nr:hypothetical protein [Pseudonocardia sp.]
MSDGTTIFGAVAMSTSSGTTGLGVLDAVVELPCSSLLVLTARPRCPNPST